MESDEGFRSFHRAIESDPIGVLLAKWRRDNFMEKLKQLPDVVDVIPSGSLARGTQIGPVRDVDLIVVFDKSKHPDYGKSPDSAATAMTHLEEALLEQLHPWRGAAGGKETEQRAHVVTYRGDFAGPYAEIIPSAPPVDVMPAVREGSHLLIPERGTGWIDADPEKLIRQVEQRQREWKYFTEVVGMVKNWAKDNNLDMKNLAVEVMVLKYCPRPGFFSTLSCGEAVAQFFEAAAEANITSLKDPAGRCGEIDPGMNYARLRRALEGKDGAAVLARQAMDAEHAWEHRVAIGADVTHPDVFWRKLFGSKYPRARKRFWRGPVTEPWLGQYKAESATTAGPGYQDAKWFGGGPEGHGPRRPNGPGGRDPKGPGRDPDGPNLGPPWPGGTRPAGRAPIRPEGPRPSGSARRRPGRVPAQPSASYWAGVFGSAAITASVPLTFG